MSATLPMRGSEKADTYRRLLPKRRQNVATASLRASARVADLLNGQSEHVAADMAKWALGVEGIKPNNTARIAVNVDVRADWIISSENLSDINRISDMIQSRRLSTELDPRSTRCRSRSRPGGCLRGRPSRRRLLGRGKQASDERRDKLSAKFGEVALPGASPPGRQALSDCDRGAIARITGCHRPRKLRRRRAHSVGARRETGPGKMARTVLRGFTPCNFFCSPCGSWR